MKIRNIFGTVFSGALGKSMIAASWHGHDYIRAYQKPKDAASPLQLQQRAFYHEAVAAWKALTDMQQELYRRLAEEMSGYNLFVQRHILAARAGKVPELPLPLRYATEDGAPVPDGALVVRKGERTLFAYGLGRGTGEIALTASDAPYTLSLRRGVHEEVIATVRDPLETGTSLRLASVRLAIALVLDVPAEPPDGDPAGAHERP